MGKRVPVKMAFTSVRVTEPMAKEVERIVLTEDYTDIGDYVRNLIRKDFKERGVNIKIEGEKTSKVNCTSLCALGCC
jgi:Arc/MetJ-type ribon-helix-helix transcriptional regulator